MPSTFDLLKSATSGSKYKKPSVGSKLKETKTPKEPSLWSKIIDKSLTVLNVPGSLAASALQYGLEEITGKDFYKDGDLSDILKLKKTSSFSESFQRAGLKSNGVTSVLGFAADVVTDPLTWLSGGLGAFTRTGKAVKAAKAFSQASRAAETAVGAEKVALLTKAAKLESRLKSTAQAIQKTQTSSLGKNFRKGVQGINKATAYAIGAKGVAEFIEGDTTQDKLKGLLFAGLGTLGVRGLNADNKLIDKVIKESKDSKTFAKNISDLLISKTSATNAIEDIIGAGKSENFKVALMKRNVLHGNDFLLNADTNAAIKNWAVNGHKLDPKIASILPETFKKDVKDAMAYSKKVQEAAGKSALDDYLVPGIETLDGKVPTVEQLRALDANPSLKRALANPTKIDSKIMRKYATDDLRDVALEKYGLRTTRNFVDSFNKTMEITERQAGKIAQRDRLKDLAKQKKEGLYEVFDPSNLKKARDTIVEDYKAKQVNVLQEAIKTKNILKKVADEEISRIKNFKAEDFVPESRLGSTLEDIAQENKMFLNNLDNAFKASVSNVNKEASLNLNKLKEAAHKKVFKLNEDIAKRADEARALGYHRIGSDYGKDSGVLNAIPGLHGVAIKDDLLQSLRNITEVTTNKGIVENLDSFIKNAKLFKVTGDFFTYWQTARAALSTAVSNPKDFLKIFNFKNMKEASDRMVKWSRYNLQIGRTEDIDSVAFKSSNKAVADRGLNQVDTWFANLGEKFTNSNNPLVDKGLKPIVNLLEKNERFSFNVLMPHFKMNAAETLERKLIKAGMSVDEAGFKSADMVNVMFGGQNWDSLMAKYPKLNKKFLQYARLAVFAPDYLTGTLRKASGVFKPGIMGEAYRKELIASTFLLTAMTEMMNYAMTGHSTLENNPGNELSVEIPQLKDAKGNNYAVSLGGNWAEPLKFFAHPLKFIRGKVSGPLKVTVDTVGYDPYNKDGIGKGIGTALSQSVPIPFAYQAITKYLIDNKLGGVTSTGTPDKFTVAFAQSLLDMAGVVGSTRSPNSESLFVK